MGRLSRGNSARLQKVLEDQTGYTDLYRTITGGPSGQRSDQKIARVRYTYEFNCELEILFANGPFQGEPAGYARRAYRNRKQVWVIYDYTENEGVYLKGWASSVALGCDVLMNGEYAALHNHDHGRLSGGKWERNPNLATV